jgi:hypothetical protein
VRCGFFIVLCSIFLVTTGIRGVRATEPPPGVALLWHLSPADSATPEYAARAEKLLRDAFQKRQGAVLMDAMAMDSLLLVEGNERFLRCGTGAGCLAALGHEAKAAFVIAGEVILREGRTVLRLILVDTTRQAVTSSATVEGEGLPTDAQIEELAVAMFEPWKYRGSLEVLVPVEGAEVLVDGQPRGLSPLIGPLSDLPAGEHLVEVRKDGHRPFQQRVRIPIGACAKVSAALTWIEGLEERRPFYRNWPFWTAAGMGTVGLVVAGILHHDAGVLQSSASACRDQGLTCAGDYQSKADTRYVQAYVFYGIGGAGMLAAGLIALIDLLTTPESPEGTTEPGVRLVPMPSGATLEYRF